MSLSILSPFHWVWLQFCLIGVTSPISSESTYPKRCFPFQFAQSTHTNSTPTRVAHYDAWIRVLWRRMPRVALVSMDQSISSRPSSPLEIHQQSTSAACRGWRYCPSHPPLYIYSTCSRDVFENFLKGCLRYTPYRGHEDRIKWRLLKVE